MWQNFANVSNRRAEILGREKKEKGAKMKQKVRPYGRPSNNDDDADDDDAF